MSRQTSKNELLSSSYFYYEKYICMPEVLLAMNNLFFSDYNKSREAAFDSNKYFSHLTTKPASSSAGQIECAELPI